MRSDNCYCASLQTIVDALRPNGYVPVALDWNNLYLLSVLTAAELDGLERARGLRLNGSPRALYALVYWDRPGCAAAFSWNACIDFWAEQVMQATAAPNSRISLQNINICDRIRFKTAQYCRFVSKF